VTDTDRQMAYAHQKLGELLVLHNTLEVGLSMLVASIAGLHKNGLSTTIINTLDFQRKCELLKAFGTVYPSEAPELRKIADLAKEIGAKRNQAAHSIIGYSPADGPVFVHMGGARAIEQKPDKPLFKVDDIRGLAVKAGDLHARVTALMKRFEQSHEFAAMIRAATADPSKAQDLANAIAAEASARTEDGQT